MEVLPNTIKELIDQLDNSYPERCPDLQQSEREIWMYAGSRQLVKHLIRLQRESEQNILEN